MSILRRINLNLNNLNLKSFFKVSKELCSIQDTEYTVLNLNKSHLDGKCI